MAPLHHKALDIFREIEFKFSVADASRILSLIQHVKPHYINIYVTETLKYIAKKTKAVLLGLLPLDPIEMALKTK